MKVYCRKEMLYPIIRFKDDQNTWGFEFRHDKTEMRDWVKLPDDQETRKIIVRYKLASKEFREALEELNRILKTAPKGRD